jgi:hypothetical protein
MPNVQPGDIAFYVGPEHRNGPRRMQFCSVVGPVQPTYRLIGCCGTHDVLPPLTMELVWSVEWSNPIPVGTSVAGQPLSIALAPEQDRYLRKLDGKLTDEDVQQEGRIDHQIEREVTSVRAHLKGRGYDTERIIHDYRARIAAAYAPVEMRRTLRHWRFGMWAGLGRFLLAKYYRARRALARRAAPGVRSDPGPEIAQVPYHCEGRQ